MKVVDKKKPVNTVPDGVWEAEPANSTSCCHRQGSPTADMQGNGYPCKKTGKPCECETVEPLPESSRPRKDGPGGD